MVGRIALGLIVGLILMVSGVRAENAGISKDEMAIRKAIESYVEVYKGNQVDESL